LLERVLAPELIKPYYKTPVHDLICRDNVCNMTYLGFNLSRYINGVAKRHGEVSRQMFGDYPIDAITNGVHVRTWASPAMSALFNEFIPGWPEDPFSLRYAIEIDWEPIWNAHRQAKRAMLDFVNREANAGLDIDVFTIGFARRATAYKRADLVLRDPDRLRRIAREVGPIQFIFGGKAHPRDEAGKDLIRKVVRAFNELHPDIHGVYMPNYDMELGRLMTAGCDLWLNNPRPPLEASGTSGMKAAVNGVPSLSTLDGWWLEGCLEGVTGWAIGKDHESVHDATTRPEDIAQRDREDAESMFTKLEQIILPMFYKNRPRYVDVMRNAIALNASFFNAHRMMLQYVSKAYYG
jgi:starch phosphorylase